MSDNKHRHRHSKMNGKSFIILPIIFFVVTYLVMYLAFAPTMSTLVSAAGMFFSDSEKDYSTEYKNIFVPVSENSTLPTVKVVDEETKKENVFVENDSVEYPQYNNQFGELIIEDCGIDNKLFFGDGEIALRNGVGIYSGSFVPGYGKTILVAGHNNTYFNGLKYAKAGQKVLIKTSYGNYEYEITETAVKKSTDETAYDLTADYENLIMYTCYPFDELGLTSQRFFVYAKLVSGTAIDTSVQEGE